MKRLISCRFNMDTACVELKFSDGNMILIDTVAVENEVADNMYQRSELDWLIYNKPLEYAQLVARRKILCKRYSTKSRMALESRADSGLNPLFAESHGGQNGMRAGTA